MCWNTEQPQNINANKNPVNAWVLFGPIPIDMLVNYKYQQLCRSTYVELYTQCAAVSSHSGLIRVAPHTNRRSEVTIAVIHGHWHWLVGSPSIINGAGALRFVLLLSADCWFDLTGTELDFGTETISQRLSYKNQESWKQLESHTSGIRDQLRWRSAMVARIFNW